MVRKTGRFLHNVPAWEKSALFCRETGRFLHNVPAWEKSACFRRWGIKENRRAGARASHLLSQAGTLFQPNSPKQGRCARSGRVPGSGARFSPKPRRCAAATLPSRDDVPLQLSQAETMCRCNSPKPGRCARPGALRLSGYLNFSRAGTMWLRRSALSRLGRDECLSVRKPGRFLHNVSAWERSACFRRWGIKESRRSGACPSRLLSQAGTLFQPNSPKPRRCTRSRGIPASGARFSPKPGPCSARALPSKDVAHDRGEFLPLAPVFLPSRDDVPP